MNEPIRVGVVGFGLAGRIFHTAVISAVPGFQLQGIVKPSGDEARSAYPNVPCYRSLPEMLGDTSIQLVVVATPSHMHFELAEQCLRQQRNVVVDKPFTLTTEEAARLIEMARERKLLLSAYQNRRWDGDFRTVRHILASGQLGRLVSYESHFDRFRPQARHNVWRESGGPGSGILLDLGTHLIDQATTLFGTPDRVAANVRIERDNGATDDAFDVRLIYDREHMLVVKLSASTLARIPGARFTLHGTHGSYVKYGLDPQEEQLKSDMRFDSPGFGVDPESDWGTLQIGDQPPQRIPTERGDYRGYYENLRDALLGRDKLAVTPEQAWRTTYLVELARKASAERRSLNVDVRHAAGSRLVDGRI
jgi:scyllo-inositol 2-dehydrogenase (NADP+)